jgi:hypothetical protein
MAADAVFSELAVIRTIDRKPAGRCGAPALRRFALSLARALILCRLFVAARAVRRFLLARRTMFAMASYRGSAAIPFICR